MNSDGIYQWMRTDWQTYCLMSAIIYIEEMKKPTRDIQTKRYKDRMHRYICFHGTRLKMKGKEIIDTYFEITQNWEKKLNMNFIGKSYSKPRLDKSGQYLFYLNPVWLNKIIATCGTIPNEYSLNTAIDRINHLKKYQIVPIDANINLFDIFFTEKKLAAGAFIISMDFECRGIQNGNVALCRSEKYKDFLEFMLKIAKHWDWTKNEKLSPVDVSYSINLGVKASPQYEFRIMINGLKEIYSLAGPLTDSLKDKCIRFNVTRSANYKRANYHSLRNDTKEKIYHALEGSKGLSSTDLQFIAGVRTDVVLDHLHNLKRKGLINCERSGKRYIWSTIP